MFKLTKIITSILICFNICVFADSTSTRAVLSENCSGNQDVLETYDRVAASWEAFAQEHEGEWNIDKLLLAVEYAAQKHKGQVRKDALQTPYIIHPLGVAELAWNPGGVRSVNVLTAALLHDTLEDTDATPNEIEALFGKRVLTTVQEVSNDPNLSTQENKQRQIDHAPTLSLNGQIVKLADRTYNVRDLFFPPPSWTQEQVNGYILWGEKLLKALRGTNQGLENRLEKMITTLRHDQLMKERWPENPFYD